jgi:hypothetical protein
VYKAEKHISEKTLEAKKEVEHYKQKSESMLEPLSSMPQSFILCAQWLGWWP